ncbi:MAG TPA: ATP-binding protein [Gammaproteobacteria bacterium]|nr:ATP-binding protein [Gammaproteobacteria bacterium]
MTTGIEEILDELPTSMAQSGAGPGGRPRSTRPGLERRLFLFLLVLGVMPLLIGGTIAYKQFREYVGGEVALTMRALADGARIATEEFLDYLRGRTVDIAYDWYISDSLESGAPEPDLSRYLRIQRTLVPESEGVFVLGLDGRVVASSDPDEVGADRSREPYFANGLKAPVVTDMRLDDGGKPEWIVAAPVSSRRTGRLLGVVANRIDPRSLSDIVSGRRGHTGAGLEPGATSEVYVVNAQELMLTESRFLPHAMLNERVDTEAVRRAARGVQMLGVYRDYRGVPITGASALIPEMGWTVIAERDVSEAFAPASKLGLELLALGLAVLPAVIGFGFVLHRDIVRPMRRLIGADQRVLEEGALAGLIPQAELPQNEWARVATVRNDMLRQLAREQAWHAEQVRGQRREAERLSEIVRAVTAHEPLAATLQLIADGAVELCRADSAEVRLDAPATGMPARFRAGTPTPAGPGPDPRIEQVIASNSGPVGSVTVARAEGAPFDEGDHVVLARLASHAAVAIENARFHDEVQDAAERKDRFLATLAHELRTPLSAVVHSLEALETLGGGGEGDAAHFRAVIRRQVGHVTRLVGDLLDVSRIGAGKLRLERGPVDLVGTVSEAVEAMKHRGRIIDVDAPPGPIVVSGDATRLDQIVKNLLDNAVKYSSADSPIKVAVAADGDEAVLEVRDHGIGVSPAQVQRLFQAYMQADSALPLAQGGLGLGLALVRGITEAHGGRVTLSSAGAGQGTVVTVRLPLLSR